VEIGDEPVQDSAQRAHEAHERAEKGLQSPLESSVDTQNRPLMDT
jgi:hypothetical protein